MKIKIQECGGAQKYAQEWVTNDPARYIACIKETIENLNNNSKRKSDRPLDWYITTINLSAYNGFMYCKLYLLQTETTLKSYTQIHLPLAALKDQDRTARIFQTEYNNAFMLVDNIHKETPNLESIGFFQLKDYQLLMVISRK